MTPPLARVVWRPCWRLVSSRFPPVGLFDRVAAPEDLAIVQSIEGLTNDRLRDQLGDITLVAPEDRVTGPGTTPIMAAFTHPPLQGSRFTNGDFGVYYAAKSIDTAIAETAFHRARFLAATNEAPIEIDMRSYAADLDAELHDIRGLREELPTIYESSPDQYGAPQVFAAELRARGSNGIAYDSVRDPGGECAAVLRPKALSPVRQGPHFTYVWNGRQITDIYRKTLHRSQGESTSYPL